MENLIEDLIEYLDEYNFDELLDVQFFASGQELIHSINENNKYDIIFMDIQLGVDDGIKISSYIKDLYPHILMIFISSFEHYVRLADAEPFGFLSKPIKKDKLYRLLDRAKKRLNTTERKYYYYESAGAIQKFDLNCAMYIYSTHRKANIKMLSGEELSFYKKLDVVYNEVEVIYPYFIRINKSYMANLSYCESVSKTEVLMRDGLFINISDKYRDTLIHKYMEYLRKFDFGM